MAHKLDIFKTLSHIDTKHIDFLRTLSEEERKGFTAYVTIQWLVGTKDPAQIYFLNELVNTFIFAFGKDHPELLWFLMIVCSDGKKKRYKWIKRKKSSNAPKSVKVIKEYFKYNTKHAEDALKCFSKDDIVGMAEELGYQKEELSKVRTEANGIL